MSDGSEQLPSWTNSKNADSELLLCEELHGAVATDGIDIASHVDLLIGVAPSSTSSGSRSCTAIVRLERTPPKR